MQKTRLATNEVLTRHINGSMNVSSSTVSGTINNIFQTANGISSGNITARSVATANVTLSGEQTISGVELVNGNLVLLTAQTDPLENWLWVVSSSAWTRPDAIIFSGQLCVVTEGTHKGELWWVDSPVVDIGVLPVTMKAHVGNYADLTTTAKTVVPAINELDAAVTALESTPVPNVRVNIDGTLYDANTGIAFEGAGGLIVTQEGTDGGMRPKVRYTLPAILPVGTTTQTLYHNGSGWVANSTLITDGSTVAIGAALNENTMLYVQGTDTGIYSEVTGEGGVAISGYNGNNGTGVQGQGDGASGIGVRGYAPDGGTAVKGESLDGYAGHFVSTSNFAVFGDTNTGVAAHFRQTGALSANTGNGVLWATRNLTLIGFGNATGAVVKITDTTTASGNLLEVVKQSKTVLTVTSDKAVEVGGMFSIEGGAYTLVTGSNNNTAMPPFSYILLTVNPSATLTGMDGGRVGFTRFLDGGGATFTLVHNDTGSDPDNRIYTFGGAPMTVFTAYLRYDGTYWRVLDAKEV